MCCEDFKANSFSISSVWIMQIYCFICTVKPGFHMIVTVGGASPRQARGHIGDVWVKWKHVLKDVADVADQTGTVRGRYGDASKELR